MSEQDNFEFDLEKSKQKKEEGMARAAMNRKDLLNFARAVAKELAHKREWITADDVQAKLLTIGVRQNLGPAAGSLFRGDEWIFTGRYIKSSRVSNHARILRVWRLR